MRGYGHDLDSPCAGLTRASIASDIFQG